MTTESMMDSLAGPDEGETAELEPQVETEVEEQAEATPEPEPEPAAAPAEPAKPTAEQLYANAQAALRESRAEQKAMREELAQLREQLKQQAKPAEPPKEEEEPDFLADPKAYVDAKEKKLVEKLKATEEQAEKTKAEQAEIQARQQLYAETVAQETEFVKVTPDYPDALQHIRTVRTSQLKVLHPDATEEQVAGQIAFEEMSFARQLLAQKKNPAQFAYQYAQAMGYKAKPPAKPARPNGESRAEARTLGSAGGTDDADGEHNHNGAKDGISEFSAARSERFKRKA